MDIKSEVQIVGDGAKQVELNPTKAENKDVLGGIKLVAEFREFVRFFATPRHLREIKTQQEFAKKFGVSQDTLTDWKQLPIFKQKVSEEIYFGEEEHKPEILSVLRQMALGGDLKAISLWLKISHSKVEDDEIQTHNA